MFISLQEQNLFIEFIIARVENFLGNLENILFEEHVQQFKLSAEPRIRLEYCIYTKNSNGKIYTK